MDRMVNVVHFPHPGREHNPGHRVLMPWNSGRHQRKFLLTSGKWRDSSDGVDHSGAVTIWGEWEPPSRVIYRWGKREHLPRFLHEPFRTLLPRGANLQNTDPMVFGERFRYTNCKQYDEQHGKPTELQDLLPGSVILFGSKRQGDRQFVLDTVFVVGPGAQAYAPADPRALANDPFLVATVVEPLRTFEERVDRWRFTLFTGATPADPAQGMFSFAPCRPVLDGKPQRFQRPIIDLPEFVNPKSHQSPRGYTRRDRVDISVAKDVWDQVVEQVLSAGCSLGYGFPEPSVR